MKNYNAEMAKIEIMEMLGFNMAAERAELKAALIESIISGK